MSRSPSWPPGSSRTAAIPALDRQARASHGCGPSHRFGSALGLRVRVGRADCRTSSHPALRTAAMPRPLTLLGRVPVAAAAVSGGRGCLGARQSSSRRAAWPRRPCQVPWRAAAAAACGGCRMRAACGFSALARLLRAGPLGAAGDAQPGDRLGLLAPVLRRQPARRLPEPAGGRGAAAARPVGLLFGRTSSAAASPCSCRWPPAAAAPRRAPRRPCPCRRPDGRSRPSVIITRQNGQPVAILEPSADTDVINASSTRSWFTRLPMCSSIHIRAPPAPQHRPRLGVPRHLLQRRTGRADQLARRLVDLVVPAQVARVVVGDVLAHRRRPAPASCPAPAGSAAACGAAPCSWRRVAGTRGPRVLKQCGQVTTILRSTVSTPSNTPLSVSTVLLRPAAGTGTRCRSGAPSRRCRSPRRRAPGTSRRRSTAARRRPWWSSWRGPRTRPRSRPRTGTRSRRSCRRPRRRPARRSRPR